MLSDPALFHDCLVVRRAIDPNISSNNNNNKNKVTFCLSMLWRPIVGVEV
jgi:hypothetical protein